MPTKSMSNSDEEGELRRGPWTLEEDSLLVNYISSHGEGRWNVLAKCAGLKRTGKSCRLRWLNYLKPDVKRGNLSTQEQLLILELHSKWGNRWSKIAQQLPGRTDNEIKNYWRTRVQKQARQLKIDSNSESFLDAIRYFCAPGTLQMPEEVASSSLPKSTNSSPMPNHIHRPLSPSTSTISAINQTDNTCFSVPSLLGTSSSHHLQSLQLPQSSEHPPSPFAFSNSFNDHPVLNNGDSGVNSISNYNMENYHPYQQPHLPALEGYDISMPDFQVPECGWASGEDMEDTASAWNMDDIWN